jgi:hypothetical protein
MANDTKLVSMKLPQPEKKRTEEVMYPTHAGGPEYPYGLQVSLETEQLAKLGVTKLPDVGATMTLTAKVEVCSVSQYESRDDEQPRRTLSLQITDLALS